jgi:hypothetical protein
LFFVGLIAAITIPTLGIDFATGQEQITKQKLQIGIPTDSAAKIAVHDRVMSLFAEKEQTYAEGADLKAKYNAEGMDALTATDIERLGEITTSLKDVNLRIDQMNADARALITLTDVEKSKLYDGVVTIRESNIPFTGVADDQNAESIVIYFANEETAKEFTPVIEEMINVPFYTEIRQNAVIAGCTSLTSDCDPLLGGVKISTDFTSSSNMDCSYSTAADRDVWWWTDYGFLTAAHCFENNASGNDVQQPNSGSGEIGDLNLWQWDTSSSDCDCAFVKKSGSEQHWKAAYEGVNDSLTFGGFGDPSVNDYVVFVGKNDRVTGLQVDSLSWSGSYNSFDSTPISHSMVDMIEMDNWGASGGDSGGVIHASGSNPDYHGIINAVTIASGSSGHTI